MGKTKMKKIKEDLIARALYHMALDTYKKVRYGFEKYLKEHLEKNYNFKDEIYEAESMISDAIYGDETTVDDFMKDLAKIKKK